jgi:hypothetical protein
MRVLELRIVGFCIVTLQSIQTAHLQELNDRTVLKVRIVGFCIAHNS